MIFLSDEDTDVKGLVSAWLTNHVAESHRSAIAEYIEQYFYRGLEFCTRNNNADQVIETSLVGTVLNGLSHMHKVANRLEFAVALFRGLGGNLKEAAKETFAKEVYGWVGENPPSSSSSKLIYTFFNVDRDRIDVYDSDVNEKLSLNSFGDRNAPLVKTANAKATLDCVFSWLEAKQPFLLVGPEGCGKSQLLHYCFGKLRATNVATIHCSAHITPQHVIQKLSQVCLVVSSSNGRVFRPKECDRLILYLKDLNLANPDKYGTCMLIAFLQQILTYGGFYDNNLEWVGLEAVQIVGSMTAGTGLGRHNLTPRFTSVIRVLSIAEPDKEFLELVYAAYLRAALPQWASDEAKVKRLAASTVSVFQQMKKAFSVDDRSHYLFTPRHVTAWTVALVRYVGDVDTVDVKSVLRAWAYEARRLFRDKLVTSEDKEKFDGILKSVLMADWSSDVAEKIADVFYVTAADANFSAHSAIPKFGRFLGPLSSSDWKAVVEKALVTFGRENRSLDDVIVINELAEFTSPGGSFWRRPSNCRQRRLRAASSRTHESQDGQELWRETV